MALLKTIDEIRKVIPRLSNLSNTANLPNVSKAGQMHIVPIIGKALYKTIDGKYSGAGPLSDDEKDLVSMIQFPLAAFTLLDDLPFLHTMITDNGIRTAQTDKSAAAHRWEFMELRNALMSYAMDGVELLLAYLYETKGKWAEWTASDEFKEIDGFLIKTGIDFAKYYPLYQPLRTYWKVRPIISDVEEYYLTAQLGREMLAWVKSQTTIMFTGNGSQVDVKKLLKKATAHLTIKHAADQLAVRFDDNGFTVVNSGDIDNSQQNGRTNSNTPELSRKLEAANREGQNYLTKACAYIKDVGKGVIENPWGVDFMTAFIDSPLNTDPLKDGYKNGNERRKIYRMP